MRACLTLYLAVALTMSGWHCHGTTAAPAGAAVSPSMPSNLCADTCLQRGSPPARSVFRLHSPLLTRSVSPAACRTVHLHHVSYVLRSASHCCLMRHRGQAIPSSEAPQVHHLPRCCRSHAPRSALLCKVVSRRGMRVSQPLCAAHLRAENSNPTPVRQQSFAGSRHRYYYATTRATRLPGVVGVAQGVRSIANDISVGRGWSQGEWWMHSRI